MAGTELSDVDDSDCLKNILKVFLNFIFFFFYFFFFPGVVSSHSPPWLTVGNAEHLGTNLGLCWTCKISLAGCDRATGALC